MYDTDTYSNDFMHSWRYPLSPNAYYVVIAYSCMPTVCPTVLRSSRVFGPWYALGMPKSIMHVVWSSIQFIIEDA